MEAQRVFSRAEIKYLITPEQRKYLIEQIGERMYPDVHGRSQVQSLYYDTPNFLLIRRSLEKPLYKEKIRLRSYGVPTGDSPVFPEIKKKYRGIVYKRRIVLPLSAAEKFLNSGGTDRTGLFENDAEGFPVCSPCDRQVADEIAYALSLYRNIGPAMLIMYEREAYYGRESRDFRVTFDDSLLWRRDDLSLSGEIRGTELPMNGKNIMEVKAGGAIPLWFCRLLSGAGIHPTSFSKYGRSYIMSEIKK